MPFENGAKLVFENLSKEDIELEIKMDIQEEKNSERYSYETFHFIIVINSCGNKCLYPERKQ
jgi:hypothetical protein